MTCPDSRFFRSSRLRGLLSRAISDERGISLLLALLTLLVLGTLTTSVAVYTTNDLHASYMDQSSVNAYQLAEAGLNDAVSRLEDPSVNPTTSTLLPSTTVAYSAYGGSVTYSGTAVSANDEVTWTITSKGTAGSSSNLTRKRQLTETAVVRGLNDGASGSSWSRFYQNATTPCLTIDTETFVTNVATKGNLCLLNTGAITGANTVVDVGGTVTITGPATSSGAKSPSAATAGWTSPTNVYASDSQYATTSIAKSASSANEDVTGYGLALPATAVIKGISVSIVRKASSSGNLRDLTVSLLKAGSPVGNNEAVTGTTYGTSNGTAAYGSTSDLWGTTWTASDIDNAGFGVRFAVHNNSSTTSYTASLDYISVTIQYTNDTNGIGTSSTPIAQANIGSTCTYNGGAAHTPCTSADHVYANTITTTSASSNPALSMPQVDFNYWWANAMPGPKHFCTNPSPGLSTTFFDNDASTTTGPNDSLTVNGEMAPAGSSYTCQVWSQPPTGGTLLGELSWNSSTHILTIKGTVYVDGSFRFDTDGEVVNYKGRATLMSSGNDEIDAVVCAGGTATTDSASCLTNMSTWNPTNNLMVLMSEHDNEYDQGHTTCSGNTPPTCYNGYLPGAFQGVLYSTADCLIHQNFQDSGPVICNTISLPNESGINPTFYTFPSTGNLTDGEKYGDTSTATHFEIDLGSETG